MRIKITKSIMITTLLIIMIITIGLSYSYFTANLTGGEDFTTITVTGGTMQIYYDSGDEIIALNIIPSNEPFATKTFTVTGNNTINDEMLYNISLIVEENTFTDGALKYKLISSNTDNFGNIAPSTTNLANINT